MKKSDLRESLLKKRLSFSSEEAHKAGGKIASVLAKEDAFIKAKRISLYSPIRGEVPTGEIEKLAIKAGKIVYLPRIIKAGKKLVFAVSTGNLEKGPYGIPQPHSSADSVGIDALDMIIIPGIGFDKHGHRLGYGMGYYDRAFGNIREEASVVGLAYSFQVVEKLPVEEHDLRVDFIVTENGVLISG